MCIVYIIYFLENFSLTQWPATDKACRICLRRTQHLEPYRTLVQLLNRTVPTHCTLVPYHTSVPCFSSIFEEDGTVGIRLTPSVVIIIFFGNSFFSLLRKSVFLFRLPTWQDNELLKFI